MADKPLDICSACLASQSPDCSQFCRTCDVMAARGDPDRQDRPYEPKIVTDQKAS